MQFIIILLLVIGIHELGHLLAALKLGVKVDRFSIGFGPRLWGWHFKETEYVVAAIPLGGYVKMDADSYKAASPLRRVGISAAGPLANFLLALVVAFFAYSYIGVAQKNMTIPGGVTWAAAKSASKVTTDTAHSVVFVGKLFTGQIGLKDVVGPVAVAKATSTAADKGYLAVVALLIAVSISIGVMNLLPLPVLDGGEIIMSSVEAATGWRMSLRAEDYLKRTMAVLLILLMAVITVKDFLVI